MIVRFLLSTAIIVFIFIDQNQQNIQEMGSNVEPVKSVRQSTTHSIASPHIMLSNCKVIFGNNQNYIQAQWPFTDKREYDGWQRVYKEFLSSLYNVSQAQLITEETANYLLLPHHYSYSNTNICTPTGMAVISYAFFEQTLISDIESRSHQNQPYSEQQIWIMLHALTSTASHLHVHGKVLGDVRSENIFMYPQTKSIKIATEVSWIGERSLQNKYQSGQNLYLTLEMGVHLSRKDESNIPFNVCCGNDDFSIGMTIAECLLLEDLSIIYQTRDQSRIINGQRHRQVIENLLRIKYYPAKLLLIVVGMIQLQSVQRFSCEQVTNCLQGFKKSILMQDSFSLTKEHYSRFFDKKYSALYDLVSDYKAKNNQKMFTNGQLSLSNAYTINGFSSVQMVKRTQNETFNLDIFDASNCTAKPFKKSQAQSIVNKSWSNNGKKSSAFKNKLQYSNVLQKLSPSVSVSRVAGDKETKQKEAKTGQFSTSGSKFVQSHVKQVEEVSSQRSNVVAASPLPITSFNGRNSNACSSQLKIFQEKDEVLHNFSFHSPESRVRQKLRQQIPERDDSAKIQRQPLLFIQTSSRNSQQSLLLPSLYEPPSSYVSYQYSKGSFTNNQRSIPEITPLKNSQNTLYKVNTLVSQLRISQDRDESVILNEV